jgi:hypothetical protein
VVFKTTAIDHSAIPPHGHFIRKSGALAAAYAGMDKPPLRLARFFASRQVFMYPPLGTHYMLGISLEGTI